MYCHSGARGTREPGISRFRVRAYARPGMTGKKIPNPVSGPRRLVRPMADWNENRGTPDVKNLSLPVVRRRGRGGREILRFAAAGFPDRKGPEEHNRWPLRK